MLVLVIKIMVIVVIAAKIVDVVEDKGHKTLWVKIGTPAMWIVGEIVGGGLAMALLGLSPEEVASPMATVDPAMSNKMFLLMLMQNGGALAAVGALYLYARYGVGDAPRPRAAD